MTRVQGDIEKLIRQRVREHPTATWLLCEDEHYSWAESLSAMQRTANGLLELGVTPGSRVAILLPNSPEFLWVHFAVLFLGALSVPVNTAQRGHALEHILRDSGASVAVVDGQFADAVRAALPECADLSDLVIVRGAAHGLREHSFETVLSGADHEPEVEVREATGGVGIMYTSGTTGPPKGVVSTGYDLKPLAELIAASGVRPHETMYTPLPLFHGNALTVSTIGSIVADARLAVDAKFSASRFWDRIRAVEAVEFNALGTMMSILLKQPARLSDSDNPVRRVLSAGAPAERWSEFEHRFSLEIIEWFGMVDAPGILINHDRRVGSIGKPVTGSTYRIVDDNDVPLPPNSVGELIFQHEKGQLTQYHNDPDATARAYRGGWFHSGDLAEMDEDGFFYYRGRKKESMRRRGENISAWEIESVLTPHPDVVDCAAFAVPSEVEEDEVMVVVIIRPGVHVEPQDLIEYCEGRMAKYAIPRYIKFVDEVPKTATQKTEYAKLKSQGVDAQTWDRDSDHEDVQRV